MGIYEHDTVISSPTSMSRYALMAMLTPARENMTKEFGSHAWFILCECQISGMLAFILLKYHSSKHVQILHVQNERRHGIPK